MKFIEIKSVKTYKIKTKQITIEQGLFPKKTPLTITSYFFIYEIMLVNVKLQEDYFVRLQAPLV